MVILLERLESLRDIGVSVPSVGARDVPDGLRAVLAVLNEAIEPFRLVDAGEVPELR